MDQVRREAFDALVVLRSPALLRTAHLLRGDRHLAQDLVQTSLGRAYTRWGRLRSIDAGEAYVRKIMLTQAPSSRRRRWRGEVPTAAVLDQAEHGEDLDLRATLRQALAGLPAPQRASWCCSSTRTSPRRTPQRCSARPPERSRAEPHARWQRCGLLAATPPSQETRHE